MRRSRDPLILRHSGWWRFLLTAGRSSKFTGRQTSNVGGSNVVTLECCMSRPIEREIMMLQDKQPFRLIYFIRANLM